LTRTAALVAGVAGGAALLLCLAAAATCARMTGHEIMGARIALELLFMAGAEDGFIVRLFRGPSWRLGLWAGAVGAAAADALLGVWSRYGPATALDALRPLTHLDLAWSLPWPLALAAIAALASGAAARGALRALP
jgi:cell division protein FtsX